MTNTNEARDFNMGPDFFSAFASELSEILADDVDFAPFSHQDSDLTGNLNRVGGANLTTENSCRAKENKSSRSPTSLHANRIGFRVSEFGKERIKLLLQQSMSNLYAEVDEVVHPFISLCRVRSWLRSKDRLLSVSNKMSVPDDQHRPCKKNKVVSSSHGEACGSELNVGMKMGSNIFPDNAAEKDRSEIDDVILFLFKNNSAKLEDLLTSHSSELITMLEQMNQKLEESLNTVMKTCRPMTIAEKQNLCNSIKDLQSKNLNRILETLRGRDLTESSDEFPVDLDEVDYLTLWRLHFYIAATARAKST